MSGYVKSTIADYVHERVPVDTRVVLDEVLQKLIQSNGKENVEEALRVGMGYCVPEGKNQQVTAVFEQLAVLLQTNDELFVAKNLRMYKRYAILLSQLVDCVQRWGQLNTEEH